MLTTLFILTILSLCCAFASTICYAACLVAGQADRRAARWQAHQMFADESIWRAGRTVR